MWPEHKKKQVVVQQPRRGLVLHCFCSTPPPFSVSLSLSFLFAVFALSLFVFVLLVVQSALALRNPGIKKSSLKKNNLLNSSTICEID